MLLQKKISPKLGYMIIFISIILTVGTGFIAQNVLNHNSYSLDSRLEEELPKILRAIERNPEDAEARIQLGLIHIQRKDWKKGLDNLIVAANKIQDEPELFYYIATSYGNLGQWKEAETYFLKVLKLDVKHGPALFALGQLEENKGHLDKAQNFYLRAIQIDDRPEYQKAFDNISGH